MCVPQLLYPFDCRWSLGLLCCWQEVPTRELSHHLGLAQTSGEMEAPLGGGDGGEGGVTERGCRGSHAGRWWSRSTSCADTAPGAGWLISPSILTRGPRGRPFCMPHFSGRGQMRSSGSGTSSRLACSPCQHLAGMAAALGGPRKVLPSFPLLGGWVLAFLLFPPFLLSCSFPARELSLWRGLVSAES